MVRRLAVEPDFDALALADPDADAEGDAASDAEPAAEPEAELPDDPDGAADGDPGAGLTDAPAPPVVFAAVSRPAHTA